jgi:serine/threonine protein phosphatase 1
MNRRIVITDIHGCFYSFKNLLEEKVKLQKKDTLYLLGDYINKGPRSREVLDYLMYLQQLGYQLHMLRGNHEQELLNLFDGKSDLNRLMSKGGLTLLNSFGVEQPQEIPLVYIDFIRAMDHFYELPDFYLVHAGFDFSRQNPFIASETLLNIRDYTVDLDKTQNRRIIHGHTPTNLSQILQSLEAKSSLHYSLDAGCAYKNNPQQAHLIALNLDSWQLMCQPNIDPSANYA